MDALEGYQSAGGNQQEQLSELADRLQQRVSPVTKRVIPWRALTIAASVLIVFTVGGLWFYNRAPVNTQQTAQVIKPESKMAPVDIVPATPEKKNDIAVLKPATQPKQTQKSAGRTKPVSPKLSYPVSASQIASAPANSKADSANDATPLNEMIVMDYTSRKKKKAEQATTTEISPKAISGSVTSQDSVKVTAQPSSTPNEVVVTGYTTQRKKDIVNSTAVVNMSNAKKVSVVDSEKLLQGQAAGVSVNNEAAPGLSFFKASSKNSITGKVVGKDDGLPIAGAIVKIKGTTTGTVTDAKGAFNLHIDSVINNTLVIAEIGYQTKEINTRGADLKAITLQPASNSLNEVVVTGYNSNKSTDEATVIAAHPREGWSSFRKYLREHAISPDGKKGTVKLSFLVDRTGMISGIKVITGLSKASDRAAIDLITGGPGWVGNTNGQAETISIKIKFLNHK